MAPTLSIAKATVTGTQIEEEKRRGKKRNGGNSDCHRFLEKKKEKKKEASPVQQEAMHPVWARKKATQAIQIKFGKKEKKQPNFYNFL